MSEPQHSSGISFMGWMIGALVALVIISPIICCFGSSILAVIGGATQ